MGFRSPEPQPSSTIQMQRTILDASHSDVEERWLTLGIDNTGVILVVCHTAHEVEGEDCRFRIISARRATSFEVKQYGGLP